MKFKQILKDVIQVDGGGYVFENGINVEDLVEKNGLIFRFGRGKSYELPILYSGWIADYVESSFKKSC
jgi:hypothetical protein